MTYFHLRKLDPEPELVAVEEEPEETVEDEPVEEPAKPRARGPLAAGLLGPGLWLTARFNLDTAVIVHVGAAFSAFYYGGWIAAGVVAVWLLAVGLFIPKEHLEKWAARIERDTPSRIPVDADEEPPADPLVAVMWKLIADAPGVHVKTLAEYLQSAAPGEVVGRAAVRAKLGARGIPVRASVRDAAGRVNEGVHRVDLQAWGQALPGPFPEAAPEPGSGPVATAVTCDVADAPTPVATPLSRLRVLLSRGVA